MKKLLLTAGFVFAFNAFAGTPAPGAPLEGKLFEKPGKKAEKKEDKKDEKDAKKAEKKGEKSDDAKK